jgi:TPR repeat protein
VKPKPTTPPRESVAVVEPPTTVGPAAPAPELAKPQARPAAAGADEIALLLQRGDQLLSTGDIASARRFFERAADQGDGAAATRLAKTYDPLYLQQSGVRGMFGDPAKAVTWYHKGISGGDLEADIRLLQLRAKFPE